MELPLLGAEWEVPVMPDGPLFEVGHVVHHKRFGYRGVIIGVDSTFAATEAWYERVAGSKPPKDRPWYTVLVDGSPQQTYVAERHLELDETGLPVSHPVLHIYFDELSDGRYILTRQLN